MVQDGNLWIQVYERETHHKWDAFTDDVLQQWQTFTRFALIQVQQLQGSPSPTTD